MDRLKYWNRIFHAYLISNNSQLSFWHGKPEINVVPDLNQPRPYYMKFHYKADYNNHFDKRGIPLLNYHGDIGLQYNPIAIAQYGLGNYNLFLDTGDQSRLNKFILVSDWMVENLEINKYGVPVWHHHFDFEYRELLKAPWYSGLAQGLGISVLARAYQETKNDKYLNTYKKSWESMSKQVSDGGVIYIDGEGNYWIEEYIVSPPTHILNGFIWSLWGVYDAWKIMKNEAAENLFLQCCRTIEANLPLSAHGYWSLYEQSDTRLPMISSTFYHQLHILQLIILHGLTGVSIFDFYAKRWEKYYQSKTNKYRSILNKTIFKIFYY